MKPIIRKIEDRFNTPFAVFENLLGNYIVRPLDWEGIWNPDGKLVGGNSIVSCPIKEDAEMICDTFNRFFELLKENKRLKLENQKLDNCLTEYTSLYKEELKKNKRALEYIETQDNFVDYKDYDNKPEQELYDVVEILRGEDSE